MYHVPCSKVSVEEVQDEKKEYLVSRYPIAGVYNEKTNTKLSLYEAYKKKVISRGMQLSITCPFSFIFTKEISSLLILVLFMCRCCCLEI